MMTAILFLFSQVSEQNQKWIAQLVKKQHISKEVKVFVEKLQHNNRCCGSTDLSSPRKRGSRNEVDWIPQQVRDDRTKGRPALYVFMSYSVPVSTWKNLMTSQNKYRFQFVIRGLPNNSFQELSKKLMTYQCPATIDPTLFEKYAIQRVPAFVFVDGNKYEGVYGNVSLDYVIEHLKENGNGVARQFCHAAEGSIQNVEKLDPDFRQDDKPRVVQ